MIETIQTDTGPIAIISEDTHISHWVRHTGRLDHDQNTLPVLRPHIKVGDVVVDAGAFIGDHTKAYLEWVGRSGIVHAFEPNFEAFKCLEINCPKARNWNCALGKDENPIRLHIDKANVGATYADTEGDLAIQKTIDSLALDRLDFMKIDVEGREVDVLKGAEETIKGCRPIMCIEINRGALKRQHQTAEKLYGAIYSLDYKIKPIWDTLSLDDEQLDVLCFPTT